MEEGGVGTIILSSEMMDSNDEKPQRPVYRVCQRHTRDAPEIVNNVHLVLPNTSLTFKLRTICLELDKGYLGYFLSSLILCKHSKANSSSFGTSIMIKII